MAPHVGQQEPREVSAEQRTSAELVKWIRKLRRIGVERGAEALQATLCFVRGSDGLVVAKTQRKRVITKIFIGAAILAMTVPLCVNVAEAARPTRQQAWGRCLQIVDARMPSTFYNANNRTAQFRACMAQMGYTHG